MSSLDILRITQGSYTTICRSILTVSRAFERLGLTTWYQIARLAISRSMVETNAPKSAPDAKGAPIKGHQLFGDEQSFNLLWISLITQNLAETNPKKK